MQHLDPRLLDAAARIYGDALEGFTYWDVLHAHGSGVEALLYGQMFFPELVEVDGALFLAEVVEDESDLRQVQRALASGNSPTNVEREWNCVDLDEFFGRRARETSEGMDEALAELVAEGWRAVLGSRFAPRRVEVALEDNDDGLRTRIRVWVSRPT